MQKNETLKTIASLRTTHWGFSEKKVSREDIETIVEHSLRTANSDNLTDYSVIVVDDPETLQKITGGESSGSSGVCLVYAVDHTRIVRCAEALGYRDFYPTNRLYNFLISLYDVHAAAQTAVVAAKSMGIDSLVTNFSHRHHPEEIKKLLHMPEKYCFPVIQVVLGYSERPVEETTGRLSKKHVIHYGTYRPVEEIDTQETIREMDGVYPGYISEKYPHALDWYFNEWLLEWYDEETHRELVESLCRSGLICREDLALMGKMAAEAGRAKPQKG